MKHILSILISGTFLFSISGCQFYNAIQPAVTYSQPDSSIMNTTFTNVKYQPNDRGGGALYKFNTIIPGRFAQGGTTTHKFKIHVEKQQKYRATLEFSVGEKMFTVAFERNAPVYTDTIIQFTGQLTPNPKTPCSIFLAGNAEAIELQSWDAEIQ